LTVTEDRFRGWTAAARTAPTICARSRCRGRRKIRRFGDPARHYDIGRLAGASPQKSNQLERPCFNVFTT
jgi:hypothetical protein